MLDQKALAYQDMMAAWASWQKARDRYDELGYLKYYPGYKWRTVRRAWRAQVVEYDCYMRASRLFIKAGGTVDELPTRPASDQIGYITKEAMAYGV